MVNLKECTGHHHNRNYHQTSGKKPCTSIWACQYDKKKKGFQLIGPGTMLFNIHTEGESIIITYLSALSRPIIVRNKHAVIMVYYYVDSKTTTTCTRLASTAVASKFSTIPTMMVANNENNSEFEASEIDDDDYVSDVGSFLDEGSNYEDDDGAHFSDGNAGIGSDGTVNDGDDDDNPVEASARRKQTRNCFNLLLINKTNFRLDRELRLINS